jgi:adenosine 3'-phospho 5'-phosphosulfate transporter B2
MARRFKNSQFLVLTNRLAGLLLSGFILLISNRRKLPTYRKLVSWDAWPPLFICSYSSLSNVLSSWFQYESLKYVTFTSQLLAKSSKSLFVMLCSKLVSNKTYKRHEYFCVGLICVGVFLFSELNTTASELISKKAPLNNSSLYTSFPGVICLLGYLISDSFTSTWQDNLITSYSISSIALMFITNVYSCIFTLVSLYREDELAETIQFLNQHTGITLHIVLLSVTSAVGQVFIFVTIQKFGALVFSLIMTTRQVLAIVLSSVVFQHSMSIQGVLGVSLIFLALFLQQYVKLKSTTKPKNFDSNFDATKKDLKAPVNV